MKKQKEIPKTENEWKEILTPEQYKVLRENGTETPFSGKLLKSDKDAIFTCVACGNPLFSSDAKFESDTGWPSFDEALPKAVEERVDGSLGMIRTEIVCSRCKSHLGHLFMDGSTKTQKRYCLNSVCLELEEN